MLLDDAALRRFREDGFVQGPRALDDARLGALRAEIDRIIAELPDGNRPENIRDPHERSRLFLDICLDSALVDAAEQVLGPDLLMWGSYGFAKRPGDGLPVDWHQDGRYFPLTPMETVTAWIAVDDADRANGCLQFVPGSHRARRILEHRAHDDWGKVRALPLGMAGVDVAAAVHNELGAGRFSLHDPYVVHGSGPNTSTRRRCGIQVLYMTRRVRLDTSDRQAMGLDWSTLKLFHCRGGGAYHYADRPDEIRLV